MKFLLKFLLSEHPPSSPYNQRARNTGQNQSKLAMGKTENCQKLPYQRLAPLLYLALIWLVIALS